jgi:hypothetical protein
MMVDIGALAFRVEGVLAHHDLLIVAPGELVAAAVGARVGSAGPAGLEGGVPGRSEAPARAVVDETFGRVVVVLDDRMRAHAMV